MDDTMRAAERGSGAFADKDAFTDWVEGSRRQLIHFCRQMTENWQDAEDAAQEAYLRAWEKRRSYRGECALMTWQMAIAKRVCLDKLRRLRHLPLVTEPERAAPPVDRETALDVQAALQKLGAEDRAILYLRVYKELGFEDIARVCGAGAATCRKRYERAKTRFSLLYGKDDTP